ncbi:MAG: hypothetical protein CMO38_00005, partial [Verrucomicrobiaceae bacterium]|nr:hypothetical protein [Verrucomicrobiaceae bacterium]
MSKRTLRKQRKRTQRKTRQQATRRRRSLRGGRRDLRRRRSRLARRSLRRRRSRVRSLKRRKSGGAPTKRGEDKAFFVSEIKDGRYLKFTYDFKRISLASSGIILNPDLQEGNTVFTIFKKKDYIPQMGIESKGEEEEEYRIQLDGAPKELILPEDFKDKIDKNGSYAMDIKYTDIKYPDSDSVVLRINNIPLVRDMGSKEIIDFKLEIINKGSCNRKTAERLRTELKEKEDEMKYYLLSLPINYQIKYFNTLFLIVCVFKTLDIQWDKDSLENWVGNSTSGRVQERCADEYYWGSNWFVWLTGRGRKTLRRKKNTCRGATAETQVYKKGKEEKIAIKKFKLTIAKVKKDKQEKLSNSLLIPGDEKQHQVLNDSDAEAIATIWGKELIDLVERETDKSLVRRSTRPSILANKRNDIKAFLEEAKENGLDQEERLSLIAMLQDFRVARHHLTHKTINYLFTNKML